MSRENYEKLSSINGEKKMSVREYKNFAQSKFGKNSVNDRMLNAMDKAVGGRDKPVATVNQLNNLNAKLKIGKVQ